MHSLVAALLAAALALPAEAGRAQLLPAGEFAARDGRPGPGQKWRVSDARGAALAAEINAIAARTPIVIDYDHQTVHSLTTGAKAPAAGWIQRVEWLSGQGLFATVQWTDAAKAHIQAGEYRYISPAILFDEKTGEVSQLLMASLVNHPALLGMEPVLTALSAQFTPSPHKEPDMALLAALLAAIGLPADTTEAAALTHVQQLKTRAEAQPAKAVLSAAVATALGVKPEADEPALLSAVAQLKTAGTGTDPGTLQMITALQGQIALLSAQLGEDKVTKAVDEALAAHKLLPAQRDWAIGLGKKDFAALSGFLASAPVIAGLDGQSGNLDRGANQDATLLSTEAAKLKAGFGLTDEQWAKAKPAAAAA